MAITKVRKGKRKWYAIHAPKLFEETVIGESFLYEPETLTGRQMTINLMSLTGNPKKQNMHVFFRITDVIEGKAKTKTIGMQMPHQATRRLIRKGRSKVADSFLARTNKDQYVRVKPIIVTRNRVDARTQTAIRHKAREIIREITKTHNFESVLNDIIGNRLQRHLRDELSGIAPIRTAEIRFFKYEKVDDTDEEAPTEMGYKPTREKMVKETEGLASLKQELLDDED